MDENSVPTSKIIAGVSWAIVFVLTTLAWVLGLSGNDRVGRLLGMTAIIMMGVSVVAHLRCYALKGIAVARALHTADKERRDLTAIR